MKREIDTLDALVAALEGPEGLGHAVIQGLDVKGLEDTLFETSFEGCVVLGCALSPPLQAHVQATGGLIFPNLPQVPYATYRPTLYDAATLTEGYRLGAFDSIADSLDGRVYAHYVASKKESYKTPVLEALAQRLHDHAIDDALADFLNAGGTQKKVVAMMGGHGMLRTEASYRQVARISHKISSRNEGYIMATGGGPGAMEATNLGAWLQYYPIEAIDEAIAMMASAPSYKDAAWWESSMRVLERFSNGGESLGIPTWYYGHEPPNLFASHIAKYFSNSLREDGLLTIAEHGVIFAPGSAGTIQEIFMDACQNHYASLGNISPMVFLNRDYWTTTKPVYPLLKTLAAGRPYDKLLTIADEEDEVIDFILSHPPVPMS